jgi:hypothetical protein
MEEPTANDLLAAAGDLKAALATIPGPRLTYFYAASVPKRDAIPLSKTYIAEDTANPLLVTNIVVQFEGTIQFNFYILDTGSPFIQWFLKDYLTIPIRNAVHTWFNVVRNQTIRRAAKARMAPIKEELMAAAWHPDRVAKLVAAGAWDVMD